MATARQPHGNLILWAKNSLSSFTAPSWPPTAPLRQRPRFHRGRSEQTTRAGWRVETDDICEYGDHGFLINLFVYETQLQIKANVHGLMEK